MFEKKLYFCNKDLFMENFKNKIRILAVTKGVSLPKLAAQAGINYANVARWAKNGNQPNLCDAYKMTLVLECSLEELIDFNPQVISRDAW